MFRNGKTETLHVTLKAMPKYFGMAQRSRAATTAATLPPSWPMQSLGVEVSNLPSDPAEESATKMSACWSRVSMPTSRRPKSV